MNDIKIDGILKADKPGDMIIVFPNKENGLLFQEHVRKNCNVIVEINNINNCVISLTSFNEISAVKFACRCLIGC